jgi:hypothetical protein
MKCNSGDINSHPEILEMIGTIPKEETLGGGKSILNT